MTPLTTNETRTPLSVVAVIIAVSAAASLFIGWLVYYHAPADVSGTHLLFLPALNALLNALATLAHERDLAVGLPAPQRVDADAEAGRG